MSPHNQSPAPPLAGGNRAKAISRTSKSGSSDRRSQKQQTSLTIATIQKSHSCQLRVSITSWREQRKVEFADFTSVIPGTYFRSGSGVSLNISKLPELVDALKAAETEARRLGLLSKAVQP